MNTCTRLLRPKSQACRLALLFLLAIGGQAVASDSLGNALYKAASQGNLSKTRDLLAEGADPDFRVGDWTALLIAARGGNTEIVSSLIESGADVAAREGGGWTALHFAAYSGHRSVVELLLEAGAPVNSTNQAGQTAMDVAKKHPAIMELLAAQGGTGQQLDQTLYNAAAGGQLADVDRLLRSGADANFRAPDGTSVLQIAAFQDHAAVLTRLIEAGARVNDSDNGRHTALTMAVQQGHVEIVDALLDAGADINVNARISAPGGQLNALHVAVDRGDLEMVKLLLARGAVVDGTADPITPPLYYAIRGGNAELVQLLIDHGAALHPDPGQQQVVNSPLHLAAGSGQPAIVELLLDAGAPTELLNAKRQTPRDVAVEKGDATTLGLFDR